MAPARLRRSEFVATLALAQDNCFGQPLESQLRSCLLSAWICDAADLGDEVRETVYWVSLLRYVGCTAHAHEVAALFGDDIAIRGQTLVHDSANPAEVMRDVIAYANDPARSQEDRDAAMRVIQESAAQWVDHNSASGCEAGDMLVQRLGLSDAVRESLRFTFERWNGKGHPAHAAGTDIPLPMRIVHLSHDMEAIGRRLSPESAVAAAVERRDGAYDPSLADLFAEHGLGWLEKLSRMEPWDAVLALDPEPAHHLDGPALEEALLVAADFIDLKSPYMGGHSRRCAQLASDAAQSLGLPDDQVDTVRRAALVHDFGITAVSNAVWDKTGPLTRAERDRVETHTLMTEQLLRRSPWLATLAPIASAHHERCDGSGYHRRVRVERSDAGACVLEAVEVYVGMTADRADRPAFSPEVAADELQRLASDGALDTGAVHAVLVAAGHARARRTPRTQHPGGLSQREVEVLELAVRGLTKQQIAERLVIAPKTADSHIQHIYTKIGVTTRAAAALWAMQNGVVRGPE